MELTREQIKEGNDKLAKLMGWYQNPDGQLDEIWFENTEFAKYVVYSIHNNYPHRDLPFYRDWNYLMKIVDKIGNLVYQRNYDIPNYNWKNIIHMVNFFVKYSINGCAIVSIHTKKNSI